MPCSSLPPSARERPAAPVLRKAQRYNNRISRAPIAPPLTAGNSEAPVQFERQGYFVRDRDSAPGKPVFNRTVGLRDTWAKVSGQKG